MLDPEALRAFVTVADFAHFVRAADRLGVVQSVVSKRLRRLEDQLETRLIERGKRNRIYLTRSGELFLPEARDALAALGRAEQLGRQFGRGEAGPIQFGYVFSAIMTGVLPRMIKSVSLRLPGLVLEPVALETPEQLVAVADGKIGFGIVRPRPSYANGIEASLLHREDVVVALATDHPLAGHETLSVRDITEFRIIVPQFHEEVGLIDVIRGVAQAARSAMPEISRTADFITAAGFAAAGSGIVIAPRSLTRLCLEGLCFRDLSDHRANLDLMMVTRSDFPAAIRNILVESSSGPKRY